MCEFETPFFVYYSHITVFVMSLVMGVLILLRGGRHPFYRNAFYFILVIALWMADDLVQWTAHDASVNLFFARISIWADLIFLFFLYFVHYFTDTEITIKKKIILALPYIFLIGFVSSSYNIQIFDATTCDYAHHKFMNLYLSFFEILYAYLSTRLLLRFYRHPLTSDETKMQVRVLMISIWFYAIWVIIYEEIGRISFLNGNYIDNTPHFVMGNLFLVSVVAFAAFKRGLFNLRNIPLDWLVFFVWTGIFLWMFLFPMGPVSFFITLVFYVALIVIYWKI